MVHGSDPGVVDQYVKPPVVTPDPGKKRADLGFVSDVCGYVLIALEGPIRLSATATVCPISLGDKMLHQVATNAPP
jgi:hypothetical protein